MVLFYMWHFYFFSTYLSLYLSSSISNWTGLSPRTISKFCWARIMIVSIGSCIGSFVFLPIVVRERLGILLSLRVGRFPLMLVSWKLKLFLIVSLLTKNFNLVFWSDYLKYFIFCCFAEMTYGTIYRYFLM